MKDARKNDLKVGIFSIIAIVILAVGLSVFSDVKFKEEGNNYTLKFKYIAGLREGAKVLFSGGILCGRVLSLDSSEEYALVNIIVSKEIIITDCTEFYIASEAMLGEKYVQVKPPEVEPVEGCNPIESGSQIAKNVEDPPDFDQVIASFTQAFVTLNDLAEKIGPLIPTEGDFDIEGISGNLSSIFQLIEDIIRSKEGDIDIIFYQAKTLLSSLNKTSEDAQDFMLSVDNKINQLDIASLNQLLRSAQRMVPQLEVMVADAQQKINQIGNSTEILLGQVSTGMNELLASGPGHPNSINNIARESRILLSNMNETFNQINTILRPFINNPNSITQTMNDEQVNQNLREIVRNLQTITEALAGLPMFSNQMSRNYPEY